MMSYIPSPCSIFVSGKKWFRISTPPSPRILPQTEGFILECPHVGLKTLLQHCPATPSLISLCPSRFSTNRGQRSPCCSQGPAPLLAPPWAYSVGHPDGLHLHIIRHWPLRSGRGTAWYRCVHLQRRHGKVRTALLHVPRPAGPTQTLWGWLILQSDLDGKTTLNLESGTWRPPCISAPQCATGWLYLAPCLSVSPVI